MSKQLSVSAHASALALVLLALTGAASEMRDARMASDTIIAPFAVSALNQ